MRHTACPPCACACQAGRQPFLQTPVPSQRRIGPGRAHQHEQQHRGRDQLAHTHTPWPRNSPVQYLSPRSIFVTQEGTFVPLSNDSYPRAHICVPRGTFSCPCQIPLTPGHTFVTPGALFRAPVPIMACMQAAPTQRGKTWATRNRQTSSARESYVLTAASPLMLPPRGRSRLPQPRQERFQHIPPRL